MNFDTNNVSNGEYYRSLIKSEYQSRSKSQKKSQSKKQIVSQREGQYYCTYIVDEKGKKILLKKVPVTQVEEQKKLGNTIGTDETKYYDYNPIKNAFAAFEFKKNMNMRSGGRNDLKELIDLLKRDEGIATNSVDKNLV